MINKENIILVPGTIQYVRNYVGYDGLDIWMNDDRKIPIDTKCLIGHSLGASYVLNLNVDPEKRFIFVNPLVKKRNILNLFVRWINFHIFEGIKKEKVVPVKYWMHTLKQVLSLLKVDVLKEMQNLSRENVVVIRGRRDRFFCDNEDVEILKRNNFKIIEVDAGHDWNENVAKAIKDLVEN